MQAASAQAADAHGYPLTVGSRQLREAIHDYLLRRWGAQVDPDGILPVLGTKELVAWLPTLLGLSIDDVVVHPLLAYPTYAVGARLAGAQAVGADALTSVGPARVRLVWLNSPSNPTGRVLPPEHLAKVVDWGRERDAVVVSDECYGELVFEGRATSVLHPEVCGPRQDGVLAVHSLSKRSSMAGYRSGFVAGDPALVQHLLGVRRHAGMMMPGPVQAASVAAWSQDEHVRRQHARYASRRAALWPALEAAGLRIEHSEGGLYLWASADEPCWETVQRLAGQGILVAPGEFYGPAGARHVRVALTATDERITAAVGRLRGL